MRPGRPSKKPLRASSVIARKVLPTKIYEPYHLFLTRTDAYLLPSKRPLMAAADDQRDSSHKYSTASHPVLASDT